MSRRSRESADPGDDPGATGSLALRPRPVNAEGPTSGPYDEDDLDPESPDGQDRVDFGALLVPVPAGGTVTLEPKGRGRLQAVHVSLPEGRLSVSALAAPTSSRLWPELATEIDASLRDGGARVRSFQGQWGRELHARTGGATSVFVGVDGPRWMLYGVATGPERDTVALDAELRRMLSDTVVVRGVSPYPVRTVLPLELPEHLAAEADEPEATTAEAGRGAAAPVAVAPPVAPVAPVAPAVNGRSAPTPPTPPAPAVNGRAVNRRAGPEPVAARNDHLRHGVPDDGPPTDVLPPLPPVTARGPAPLDLDRHDTVPIDTVPIEVRAMVSGRRRAPESEPITELLPVVRPFPAPPSAEPRPIRHARQAPEEPSAEAAAGGRHSHDPALTFLIGDPMALFTAAPAGRHRRRS